MNRSRCRRSRATSPTVRSRRRSCAPWSRKTRTSTRCGRRWSLSSGPASPCRSTTAAAARRSSNSSSCSNSSAGRPTRHRCSRRRRSTCRWSTRCPPRHAAARHRGNRAGQRRRRSVRRRHRQRDGDGCVLNGIATQVFDADRADAIAVVADGGVFLVRRDAVAVTREPSIDPSLRLCTVRFDDVSYRQRTRRPTPATRRTTRARSPLVGLAAVIVGASQRVFDLALDHLKSRHQFGVPIGSFQAIKHMAVDVYVALERARAVTQFAALMIAADDPRRADRRPHGQGRSRRRAAHRRATRHPVLRRPRLHVGERPAALRAARQGRRRCCSGNAAHHRVGAAATHVLARIAAGEAPPELTFDDATEAFRREFDAWLDANIPSDDVALADRSRSSAAHPRLGARSGSAPCSTPDGSCRATRPSSAAATRRCSSSSCIRRRLGRRRIYQSFNPQGVSIITPSILSFGTEEQKRKWAIPILRAEITAALGMSEPDAGSDLAGLRTRAVLRRRQLRRERAEGVDLGRARRRRDPRLRAHRSRRAEAQGHQLPGHPDRHARRHVSTVRLDPGPRRHRLQRGVLRRRASCPPRT